MMNKSELKFTETHEWIHVENNIARVGITEHAQQLLGDIVFIEQPQPGQTVKQREEICTLESVKAAADVYSPLSGTIIEINPALQDSPEFINTDPYGKGWLFAIQFSDATELETLLNFSQYEKLILVEA